MGNHGTLTLYPGPSDSSLCWPEQISRVKSLTDVGLSQYLGRNPRSLFAEDSTDKHKLDTREFQNKMFLSCLPLKVPAKDDDEKISDEDKLSDENVIIEEITVESILEGYPDPVPPDPTEVPKIKRSQRWFEDFDYLASDDTQLFNFQTTENYVNSDSDLGSRNRSNRSKKPKVLKKETIVSFEEIDEHARKADDTLLNSMDDLLIYLAEPLKSDPYRKMKTARAIVAWMSNQNLSKDNFGKRNINTPRGLLQYLKEENMSHTTCYTILCRKAGLQCVVIYGYSKGLPYEPGNKEVPFNSWCAVYVECGWQIVMPFWICESVFGYKHGGWIKVEEDGQPMRQKEKASSGVTGNTFREEYFMPNPDEFIYRCCAAKTEWQLVRPEKIISSVQEFSEMPCLYFQFFEASFQLISEPKCSLKTRDGFCNIEMKTSPAFSPRLVLNYELFLKETNDRENTTENNFSRMVFNARAGTFFTFDIRFPQKGFYKLVIFGGPYKLHKGRLCEFQIVCEQEMTGRNLLPLECQDIGWGPGPVAAEAGLLLPSKPNGLIPVSETKRKTEIRFHLQSLENEYTASVHGEVSGKRKKLEDNLVTVNKNPTVRQLLIGVSIPGKGEFGVSIAQMESTCTESEKTEKVVCNYLLSTYAFKGEYAEVRIARKCLQEALEKSAEVNPRSWKKQINVLEEIMKKCEQANIPDNDDDLLAARETVGLLRCKDKLRDCELRRNLQVIYDTLDAVSRYKNKALVSSEVERVNAVKDELIALHGFVRPAPKIEDAYREITFLPHVQDEVLNTLKALLVLLGETQGNVKDWTYVVNRLKVTSHSADSIIGQMKSIQGKEISSKKRLEALTILHRYQEDDVRRANSDAHSFNLWVENFVTEKDDMHEPIPDNNAVSSEAEIEEEL